ncbi:MAG: TonB-dependent receptor [Bacteroidia bacterium]|nr:TonB-dependent receptor [Bacteroidia bacterium]
MARYKILFVCLLTLFTDVQNLCAQQIILNGTVLESDTKLPVAGAVVKLGKVGNVTDINGKFSLIIIELKVTDTLAASFIGYLDYRLTLNNINITEPITILMQSNNQLLNQVVVSAGRYEQSVKRTTVSTEVIRPYLIQNRLTTNMDKLLDQVPSVSVVDGQINIRNGSGWTYGAGSRVMVLLDDMPFLTGDAGQVKWNFVPVENVQQVEVIKGASSVLYGSSALNGIVHFRTEMATKKPITRIHVFGGGYVQPKRNSLNWTDKFLKQYGFNAFHSFKKKNAQYAFSTNYLRDEGYRMGETENRLRFTVHTKYKLSPSINIGLNVGALFSKGGSFLFWESYEKGYTILDSQITNTQSNNLYVDPYINIFTGSFKHTLRARWMYINNDIQNADPTVNQDNSSRNIYGEYQLQRVFTDVALTFTGGLAGNSNVSNSPLFNGSNQSKNIAAFVQLDKIFFRKLFVNAGARYEHFNMNGSKESKPVFRAGANYELGKSTFIRASYGQGYRFPSIAERYIKTSVGQLNVFSNPALHSETGWNAEVGIKQGFSVGSVKGFLDVAYFFTRYQNMIDFNFGVWNATDPFKGIGFKTLNVGETQISGIDISLNSEGKIGKILIQSILGYTYTNPISLNPDYVFSTDSANLQWSFRSTRSDSSNVLKYRYKHLAKFDLQATYLKWQVGLSLRYNSFMINVDRAFVDPNLIIAKILTGVQQGRNANKNGNIILDMRASYQLTKYVKLSIAANNIFNAEVMTRPADLRPPRWVLVQFGVSF